jgi:hypothetical protein
MNGFSVGQLGGSLRDGEQLHLATPTCIPFLVILPDRDYRAALALQDLPSGQSFKSN